MIKDDKLPPEWNWEPEKLTLSQMLRRDLFPRWEWIERVDPDLFEKETNMNIIPPLGNPNQTNSEGEVKNE